MQAGRFVFSKSASWCTAACDLFEHASSEFAFQPCCMHMYHPLFRQCVCVRGAEVEHGSQFIPFPRNCLKKKSCLSSVAVDGLVAAAADVSTAV